jgi:hypothetical protein
MKQLFSVPAACWIVTLLTACSGTSTTPSLARQVSQHKHPMVKRNTSECPCLYVVNYGNNDTRGDRVTVYPIGASGNVKPIQEISGNKTRLTQPSDVAVDTDGSIYVANGNGDRTRVGPVTVYAPGANGNVKPIRTIAGSNTKLSDPSGVALDSSANLYVTNGFSGELFPYDGYVTVYAAGADGNVKPSSIIMGSKTRLWGPEALALDSSNEVYVPNFGINALTVYAAGADGNVPPKRTIRGSKTSLAGPLQIALDSDSNIYVANYGPPTGILVYAATAHGNVKPVRTIEGAKTEIDNPQGVALDGNGNIYVANSQLDGYITVYAEGANGNVAPINTIKGGKTHLHWPHGIAIR